MGYLHIENLYKKADVLMFRTVFAMEKVDGTSAHIKYHAETKTLTYFSGCANINMFKSLFNETAILENLSHLPYDVTVYGEAYGGKIQKMGNTYGPDLKFIAFDVCVKEDSWLNVDKACDFATKLGIEFVPFRSGPCTIEWLNEQRDLKSEVAIRRGMGDDKLREGIVIRPMIELKDNAGNRIITKHKGDHKRETKDTREVNTDQTKLKVLADAKAISEEWCTEERLNHVLSKLEAAGNEITMKLIPTVISSMWEDILREGQGEFVVTSDAEKEVTRRTVQIFKEHLRKEIQAK